MSLTRRLENWDMSFGTGRSNYAESAEACGQNVKSRLLLLAGEWFLDADAGLPYLGQIVIKPANLPLAESLIKRRILDTDGVAEITGFLMDFDSNTRRLTVSAQVRTIYDDITTIKANLL